MGSPPCLCLSPPCMAPVVRFTTTETTARTPQQGPWRPTARCCCRFQSPQTRCPGSACAPTARITRGQRETAATAVRQVRSTTPWSVLRGHKDETQRYLSSPRSSWKSWKKRHDRLQGSSRIRGQTGNQRWDIFECPLFLQPKVLLSVRTLSCRTERRRGLQR